MELALVYKKGLSRFASSTMREHNIYLSLITVFIIQNLGPIFFLRDVLLKIFSILMEIRTKRLVLNRDTRHMFSLGLLGNSRKRFQLQFLAFQRFYLMKDFVHTSCSICKLTLLMQQMG